MLKLKKFSVLLLITAFCFGCQTFSQMTAKSGVELELEMLTDEPNKDEIFELAKKKINRQLDLFGENAEISEIPNEPYRLKIKIYEPKDIERLKEALVANYQFELKKAVSPPEPARLQMYMSAETAKDAAKDIAKETGRENLEILPYQKKKGELADFIIVEKEAIVDGNDISSADIKADINQTNYSIQFTLKPEGAKKISDWSGENIGSYLAIILNKTAISVPVVKGQIADSGEINGGFTKKEAEDIVANLKVGYLPAKLRYLSEKPFGNPTP